MPTLPPVIAAVLPRRLRSMAFPAFPCCFCLLTSYATIWLAMHTSKAAVKLVEGTDESAGSLKNPSALAARDRSAAKARFQGREDSNRHGRHMRQRRSLLYAWPDRSLRGQRADGARS